MAGRDEVDRVLRLAIDALGNRLGPDGWVRRDLGRPTTGTFTRATRNGVLATLEVSRAGVRFPDGLPVDLRVVAGVGHETVLSLAPLLTLHPAVALSLGGPGDGWNGTDVELADEAGIPGFVSAVAAVLDGPARAHAEAIEDLDALVLARRRGDSATDPSKLDVLVVTASGRDEEARALLAAYEARLDGADRGVGRVLDRRFVRQVHRWLDAGPRAVPPLEQTLDRLPAHRAWDPVPFREVRRQTAARGAASKEVRARGYGKSVEVLLDELTAEYVERGLEVRPAVLATTAEQIRLARRPLGRARLAVRRARVLADAGTVVVHRLRNLGERDAPWLRPPDRATYPLRDHRSAGSTTVVLDPGVEDLLTRVLQTVVSRVADSALIEVWFTVGSDAPDPGVRTVVVHIGEHRVGTVAVDDAPGFAAAFRAAALFDEDPVLSAVLSRVGDRRWYLEFETPAP